MMRPFQSGRLLTSMAAAAVFALRLEIVSTSTRHVSLISDSILWSIYTLVKILNIGPLNSHNKASSHISIYTRLTAVLIKQKQRFFWFIRFIDDY